MPTRRYTRVYRRPAAAASQEPPLESDFASLVDLLHAIQQHSVPILPISPHKTMGVIGRGLSGDIEQSRANVATLLAFKEGIPDKLERDTEWSHDWHLLVTQVTLLQHPPIQANPHFIDLLGLSFYVPLTNAAKERAWPLLVTSKVNCGDLASFLLKNQLDLLTNDIRLQLFAEVAEAVYVLHECGVAHGDIKPENFLMDQFEEGEGELNCMLTDFGSSTIRGQKRLPTLNEPWNAPELDIISSGLGFEELAQTDIFAFGLISIHILMPLKELENFDLCLIRRPDETDDRWRQKTNAIRTAKKSRGKDGLTQRVLRLIEASGISAEWRNLIREVIVATIEPSAGRRYIPWSEILPFIEEHLSDSFSTDPRISVQPPPTTYSSAMLDHSSHEVFNFAASLGELDDQDYILRANVVEDILNKASKSTCEPCRKDYAFQFAVSRQFGFGATRGQTSHVEFLEKSGKTRVDLSAAIQRIGLKYEFTNAVPKSVLNALARNVLVSDERVQEYQMSRRMNAAKAAITEEIDTRTHELGPDHLCLARLKWDLSLLLKAQASLQDAETSQREVTQILAHHRGEHHISTLTAGIVLANILGDRGLQSEAVSIYQTLQPLIEESLGWNHPETITVLQLLGLSFLEVGQLKDAVSAFEKVVLLREKFLSPMHPLSVQAELCLATALRLQGHMQKALGVLERIDGKLSSYFTHDDLVKVQVYISKAALCNALSSLDQAEETISKALRVVDSLQLVEDDDLRLAALEVQASIHESREEFDKEESVLRRILRAKIFLGDQNPAGWGTKTRLAESLLRQGQLIPAHDMAKEVVTASEGSNSEVTDNLLRCASVQARTLSRQGRKDRAFEISHQFRDSCLRRFGSEHHFTVQATNSLVGYLIEQTHYQEVRPYCEEMLPYYRQEQNRGADGIMVLRCIAFICDRLGDFSNAVAYWKEAISWATEVFGEGHVETLKVYDRLVRAYMRMGKHSDAESIYCEKLESRHAGSQLDPAIKSQLAELRLKEDKGVAI